MVVDVLQSYNMTTLTNKICYGECLYSHKMALVLTADWLLYSTRGFDAKLRESPVLMRRIASRGKVQ
jgi:hypothetical protein